MLKVHEECGSWETRKGYNGITFKEIEMSMKNNDAMNDPLVNPL